jgi:lipopolysaccharide cholinephosphotransferase
MKKITDEDKLKEIHLKLLDELIEILNDNNIEYFLYYGSLLGAVRHKGFIPWDDDVDLAMTRENYEKFKKVKIAKEYLEISAPGTHPDHPYFFTKFHSKNYICLEDMDYPLKGLGINIDIFPVDYIPRGKIFKKTQDIIISFLVLLLNLKVILLSQSRSWLKNFLHMILKIILKPVGVGLLTAAIDKVSSIPKNTETMGCRASIYRGKECFRKEFFQSHIRAKFENIECSIPKEYDGILKGIYGNYLVLPEISKRHSSHSTNVFFRSDDFFHEEF